MIMGLSAYHCPIIQSEYSEWWLRYIYVNLLQQLYDLQNKHQSEAAATAYRCMMPQCTIHIHDHKIADDRTIINTATRINNNSFSDGTIIEIQECAVAIKPGKPSESLPESFLTIFFLHPEMQCR